ncbi:MAG: hypothetical protein AAF830_03680 [Pseudomonadota bacterium]
MALHDAAAASAEIAHIDGLEERLLDGETVLWAEESGQEPPSKFQKHAKGHSAGALLLLAVGTMAVAALFGWGTESGTFSRFMASAIFVIAAIFAAFLMAVVTDKGPQPQPRFPADGKYYAITDRRLLVWDDKTTWSITARQVFAFEREVNGDRGSVFLYIGEPEDYSVGLINIKNSHYAERLLLQLCSEPGRIKP